MENNHTNWSQSVTGVVINNGKVLLARHTYGAGKGLLIVPGGYVEYGELPQQALKREYLEETNTVIEPKNIIAVRFNAHDWYVAFRAEYISGEAVSDNDENSEVVWLAVEEALSREDVADLTKKLIRCALDDQSGLTPIPYYGSQKNGKGYLYGVSSFQQKSLLETTLNTRELGGYLAVNGLYTRNCVLFRSDFIRNPNEHDITYLKENKITTIIDMRGADAVQTAPSPFAQMERFQYYHVPIEEGGSIPESVAAVPLSYLKIAQAANIYQVFRYIANAPEGVLFHCAAGKDRTGVVSAILLLLAGVSDKNIIDNYMLTKECNQKRFAALREKFPETDINIVIPCEDYMVQFLQLFREKYGSAEAYLQAIRITNKEIMQLKGKLLE